MAFRMARPILDPNSRIGIYKVRPDADIHDKVRGSTITVPIGDAFRTVKVNEFVQVSLGTRDPKEIKERFNIVDMAVRGLWEQHRNPPTDLTSAEMAALQAEIIMAVLHNGTFVSLKPTLSDPVPSIARRLLASKGILTTEKSVGLLDQAVQNALKNAAATEARRNAGDYLSDAEPPKAPAWKETQDRKTAAAKSLAVTSDDAALPFSVLVGMWHKARKPAEETATAWKRIVDKFILFVGFDDAARVSKKDIERWRDQLREQGLGAARIKDGYIASLKAILGFASDEGHLPVNVARDVKVTAPKVPTTRPKSFTAEEAQMILKAALGPHEGRHAQDTVDARRWVPWLCAYTGARVAEITQLRKEDLIEEHGVVGIRINPDAGSTKTGRFRDVPLHPHLIEQGFVEFIRKHRTGPLFYNAARATKNIHRAHKTRAEGMAEWVRSIGLIDMRVDPNHGWRHRFKTESRRHKLEQEVRDYIQGHAPRSEGEDYGEMPLDVTYAEIIKLPRYEV